MALDQDRPGRRTGVIGCDLVWKDRSCGEFEPCRWRPWRPSSCRRCHNPGPRECELDRDRPHPGPRRTGEDLVVRRGRGGSRVSTAMSSLTSCRPIHGRNCLSNGFHDRPSRQDDGAGRLLKDRAHVPSDRGRISGCRTGSTCTNSRRRIGPPPFIGGVGTTSSGSPEMSLMESARRYAVRAARASGLRHRRPG